MNKKAITTYPKKLVVYPVIINKYNSLCKQFQDH